MTLKMAGFTLCPECEEPVRKGYMLFHFLMVHDIEKFLQNGLGLETKIIKILEEHGAQTRGNLCQKLDKRRTTIFDALHRLENLNRVARFKPEEVGKERNKIGRPLVWWALVNDDEDDNSVPN